MKKILLMWTLLNAVFAAAQTAGRPDSTFGVNGIAVLNYRPSADFLTDMGVLPGGKILLLGNAYPDGNTVLMTEPGLMQLLPDGNLDNSFSADGMFFSAFSPESHLDAMAVQPDGKIIAVGTREYLETGETVVFLARFKPNGDLDLTFGLGGKVYFELNGAYLGASAVALQPDGKILVAGGVDFRFLILRFLPNGFPDVSFGEQGVVTASFSGGRLIAEHLAVQPDGKVLAGGNWWNPNTPFGHTVLARLLPNGAFDSTFAETGFRMYQIEYQYDNLVDFALLPGGQIVGAAQCIQWVAYPWEYHSAIALFRLNADGTADRSFGDQGLVKRTITDPGTPFEAGVNALAIQSDRKIVLGGSLYDKLLVLRYLPNGAPDSAGFGNDGVALWPIAGYYGGGEQIAMSADGNIILAGNVDLGNNDLAFVAVRFLSDLKVDVSNGPGGTGPVSTCYPNPLTNLFTMQYALSVDAEVRVQCFDLQGRLVATLLPATSRPVGEHVEPLRLPDGLPAGPYLLRLEAGANGSAIVRVFKN